MYVFLFFFKDFVYYLFERETESASREEKEKQAHTGLDPGTLGS